MRGLLLLLLQVQAIHLDRVCAATHVLCCSHATLQKYVFSMLRRIGEESSSLGHQLAKVWLAHSSTDSSSPSSGKRE